MSPALVSAVATVSAPLSRTLKTKQRAATSSPRESSQCLRWNLDTSSAACTGASFAMQQLGGFWSGLGLSAEWTRPHTCLLKLGAAPDSAVPAPPSDTRPFSGLWR